MARLSGSISPCHAGNRLPASSQLATSTGAKQSRVCTTWQREEGNLHRDRRRGSLSLPSNVLSKRASCPSLAQ